MNSKRIVKAILAGMMIAVASLVYLNCENKIVGAFLFAFGLLSIMVLNYNLFTGFIGFATKNDIFKSIEMLIGNVIGCFAVFLIPSEKSAKIVAIKLETPLYYVFGKAIICGMIIYICVLCFKKYKNMLITLVGIPAFILCGAEHCIADICFLMSSGSLNFKSIMFIIIVILGNSVGSKIVHILTSKGEEK